jgi:hypothetical protein
MYTIIQQYERALEVDRRRELEKECQWREAAGERLDSVRPEAPRRANSWWSRLNAFLAGLADLFPGYPSRA